MNSNRGWASGRRNDGVYGMLATLALSTVTPVVAQGTDDLLTRVEAAGVVRVALTLASPPWSFLDAQT